MNKDTIIGFALIALVLIGFSWYNQPSQEEIEAARKQDSIATVMQQNAAKKQKAEEAARKAQAEAAAQGVTTAAFYAALNGKNEPIVLKNGKVELTFNTKGGTLVKAVIKGFENLEDGMDVTLFDEKTQHTSHLSIHLCPVDKSLRIGPLSSTDIWNRIFLRFPRRSIASTKTPLFLYFAYV